MKKITLALLASGLFLSQALVAQIPTLLTENDFSTKTETITDTRDGKTYHYKTYGTADWFMQNLNWDGFNGTDEGTRNSVGTYGPDGFNIDGSEYGRFYHVKNDDVKQVCPQGWSIPTMEDWTNIIEYLSTTYNKPDLRKNNDNLWLFWKAAYYMRGGDIGTVWTYGTKDPLANEIQFNLLPSGWLDDSGLGFMQDRQNQYFGEATLIYTLGKEENGERPAEMYWTGVTDSGNDNHENLRHHDSSSYFHANVRCIRNGIPQNISTTKEKETKVYPSVVKAGQAITIESQKQNAKIGVYNISGQKIIEKIITEGSGEVSISGNGLYIITIETINNGTEISKVTVK